MGSFRTKVVENTDVIVYLNLFFQKVAENDAF